MFIFLDESGDLGFDFSKSKTTKRFVITLLVCDTNRVQKDFKKAIKRTLRNKLNKPKNKSRRIVEMKGTNSILPHKEYFFRQLKRPDWGIYSLVLNKERVSTHLRTRIGKKKLYNFLAAYLLKRLPLGSVTTNVELILDKCKNKDEIWDFNRYVENQIEARLPLKTGFDVSHLCSIRNAGLQAVDLFCWGVFRKYEFGDERWYEIYRHKIRFETEYFP